jgi:two-component system response regulator AtoC
METVLVVDQDPFCLENTATYLKGKGFHVLKAENGTQALSLLKTTPLKALLIDQDLTDLSINHFFKQLKETKNEELFIILMKNSDFKTEFVFDYPCLEKPFQKELLEDLLSKVKKSSKDKETEIVFKSELMLEKISQAKLVSKTDATVLISGESGTGKEVFADLIQKNSLRSSRPFIKVNCAAIAENLVESEFFGHEKGAFTGALQQKLGRFELAHTGTLLLDEVTEISLPLQAKLLRVLQELEFERVGGVKPIKINVRIISTTNRVTEEAVKNKILREDLYYRLNVIPIHLPPLREHKEDILPLATHFLKKICLKNHIKEKALGKSAEKVLLSHSFPGNIRELGNIIERACVLTENETIEAKDISLLKPY